MLVSIITVCFNSAETIEDTIKSVLDQTYNNIEYLIIDGSSSDETLSIIKYYEPIALNKGLKFKWISEPDKGIYDAMNKGIKMANGVLVGILNSDDWYRTDAIENIVNSTQNISNTIITGCRAKYSIDKIYRKTFFNTKNILKTVRTKMPVNHPSTFVAKDVYDRVGAFNIQYKLSADYDFIYRCCLSNVEFIKVNSIITNMRDGGATGSNRSLFVTAKEDFLIQRQYGGTIRAVLNYSRKISINMLIIIRSYIRRIKNTLK